MYIFHSANIFIVRPEYVTSRLPVRPVNNIGHRFYSMCHQSDRGSVIRHQKYPVIAEPLDPLKNRTDNLLIKVLYGLYLVLYRAAMAGFIGRFYMNVYKVTDIESLERGIGLADIVCINVPRCTFDIDDFKTRADAEALREVDR